MNKKIDTYEIGNTIKTKNFNTNRGAFVYSINFDSFLNASYFYISFKQPINFHRLDLIYGVYHYSNCYTARVLLVERKSIYFNVYFFVFYKQK